MILAIVVFVIVVIFSVWLWSTYNKMVAQRINVETSFSQIDVQLKRRHDLIPNLVETVKGYATHESKVFEEVTEMRAKAMSDQSEGSDMKQQAAAEGMLGMSLGRLVAIAENYPELKASENFQQLSGQLSDTEDKIFISRQVYNDTVNTFNTTIQQFPTSLAAGMFHFEKKDFFDTPEEEKVAPTVSFS